MEKGNAGKAGMVVSCLSGVWGERDNAFSHMSAWKQKALIDHTHTPLMVAAAGSASAVVCML